MSARTDEATMTRQATIHSPENASKVAAATPINGTEANSHLLI